MTSPPPTTSPPLVAVDIGNSSTKIGWFGSPAESIDSSGKLPSPIGTFGFATGWRPPEDLAAALPAGRCRWRVASVNREGTRLLYDWIASNRPGDEVRMLTHHDLPIRVSVDFPDRVGLDRLAAAVGANLLRLPGRPAIVVDAGSAITVDLVTADGAFAGGVILPGFRMAAEALFGGADLLPLANLAPDEEPPPVVGKNTQGAIRSGLFWGAVGAVREIVHRMSVDLPSPPQIIVTGGDLRRLAEYVGGEARFVPHLVLSGIAVAG